MDLRVGDKVIFTNIKKIRNYQKCKLQENLEYVVIGLDRQDGCPYIAVDDVILYTHKSEQRYIEVQKTESLSPQELEQLLLKFPYIPKNKTVLRLVELFEQQNNSRWLSLAIDVALDEKNFVLIEKLLKMKKGKRRNNPKEERG